MSEEPTGAPDVPQVGGYEMPDWVKSQIMVLPGNKRHIPAGVRIAWFRATLPTWGVETDPLAGAEGGEYACVRAVIRNDEGRVMSSGMKQETQKDFAGSWLEKAETGAIARAVAALGFGAQYSVGLQSSDDSHKGAQAASVDGRSDKVWPGPGQCVGCKAPAGKPHATSCRQGAVAVSPEHVPAGRIDAQTPAHPATAPTPTAQAPAAQQAAQGQETAPTAAAEAKAARIALFARLTGLGYDTEDKGGRDRLGTYALGAEAPASWGKLTKPQALKLLDVLDVAPPSEIKRVWAGIPEPAAEPALFVDQDGLTDPFGDE